MKYIFNFIILCLTFTLMSCRTATYDVYSTIELKTSVYDEYLPIRTFTTLYEKHIHYRDGKEIVEEPTIPSGHIVQHRDSVFCFPDNNLIVRVTNEYPCQEVIFHDNVYYIKNINWCGEETYESYGYSQITYQYVKLHCSKEIFNHIKKKYVKFPKSKK